MDDFINSNDLTKLYYRVKQIDNDGGFKYSSTISVNFSKTINITISPNPGKNSVSVSAFGVKNVRLLNLDGQVIKNWKSVSSHQYNINNIPNGIYLLEVTTGEASQIEKLIIQR